jgi:hypothetical protein
MSALGATLSGDRYQTRLFWYHAVQILYDDSIETVELESPDAKVFDDIILNYRGQGRLENGRWVRSDFFQIKYHVDASGSLKAANLIEPKLTKTKESMLARFYGVFKKISGGRNARLNLVTNWHWHPDDEFAKCWRRSRFSPVHLEDLPKSCTTATDWARHLECSEAELKEFLAHLRIHSGWADLDQLQNAMNDRFRLAGLIPVEMSAATSPYDDLGFKFIENGQSSFNRDDFQRECQAAKLIAGLPFKLDFGRMATVSSFNPPSPIGSGAAIHVDLSDQFVSKRVAVAGAWNSQILPRLSSQLSTSAKSLHQPILLMPDCHISIAIATGRLLDPKKGFSADVLQHGRAGTEVWKAEDGRSAAQVQWIVEEPVELNSPNLAVSVQVAQPIHTDVANYLAKTGLTADLLKISSSSTGRTVIRDSAHAWGLAEALVIAIISTLRKYAIAPKIHFFYSGPNGLAVRIGQESALLGEIQLYEFDFEETHKYTPSILLLK